MNWPGEGVYTAVCRGVLKRISNMEKCCEIKIVACKFVKGASNQWDIEFEDSHNSKHSHCNLDTRPFRY